MMFRSLTVVFLNQETVCQENLNAKDSFVLHLIGYVSCSDMLNFELFRYVKHGCPVWVAFTGSIVFHNVKEFFLSISFVSHF